jgi:Right handed beta helix region
VPTEVPTEAPTDTPTEVTTATPTRTATATPTRTPTKTPIQLAAAGAVYYVDSIGGNDANAGTSPSTAWKSLRKAKAAPLAPGARLLFRRGGSWSGNLTVSRSGSSGNPIVVGAYGSGNLPVLRGGGYGCVVVTGSYVVVQQLAATGCAYAGIDLRGDYNVVRSCLITRNVAGVFVEPGANANRILRNRIVSNNRMAVDTPGGDDDYGAFGVLVNGDRTEIAYNTISGSDAHSYDYGRDGSAVEIDGARNSNVHHNRASNNDAFTELGGSRSADNTFRYNVVTSSLASSSFVVTRGGGRWGPVTGTRVYHNSVVLTGASSQGIFCSPGCGPGILVLKNNVIQAAGRIGYTDAGFDVDYNVFWGGPIQGFGKGAHSVIADPRFVLVANGDLHLRSASPAIDRGASLGYSEDYDGNPVPVDGNGDGVARPDAGAFEFRG